MLKSIIRTALIEKSGNLEQGQPPAFNHRESSTATSEPDARDQELIIWEVNMWFSSIY